MYPHHSRWPCLNVREHQQKWLCMYVCFFFFFMYVCMYVCMYALYLYFLGLSFRNTSKALEPFEQKKEISCYVEMGSKV